LQLQLQIRGSATARDQTGTVLCADWAVTATQQRTELASSATVARVGASGSFGELHNDHWADLSSCLTLSAQLVFLNHCIMLRNVLTIVLLALMCIGAAASQCGVYADAQDANWKQRHLTVS
jgi:hypothetical protein